MFFTIPSLCQFGTAGMTARFHWFSRHTNYPFPLCTQRGKGWKATLRQKKRPKANAFSPVSFFRILRITQKKSNVSLLLVYFQSTNLILFFFCSNMAEGNDPLFTIAHAWLQVTPSVHPCSFAAMRIQHGGFFHYNTSFKRI